MPESGSDTQIELEFVDDDGSVWNLILSTITRNNLKNLEEGFESN